MLSRACILAAIRRLEAQKVLVISSKSSLTFPLKFLSLVPHFTPIPYCLVHFPSVFLFSYQDTSLPEGMTCTNHLLDFFFLICLIAYFFKREGHSLVFKFPEVQAVLILLPFTPNNRFVVCSTCHRWNLLEKAALFSHFLVRAPPLPQTNKVRFCEKKTKIMLSKEWLGNQWTTYIGRKKKEEVLLFVFWVVYS